MKDRQKIFLDRVVKLIVDDTGIDYDKGSIYYPFFRYDLYSPLSVFYSLLLPRLPDFTNYCKERYGLTDEEIKYVWDQYKTFIKDKISNKES